MKIPVTIYEQLPIAFGAAIWFDFCEIGELKWSNGIPYRVTVQKVQE